MEERGIDVKMMDKSLLDCRIVEVKGGQVRGCYPRLIGKNGKRGEHGYGCYTDIVMLRTETGHIGWGLGRADRTLKLWLEGSRVSDVFLPEKGILSHALCAADVALHDLAGKILGIPVSRMINPDSEMKALCYDGAIYLSDLTEQGDKGIEAVLEDCRADILMGLKDFKVKIGRGKNWMDREHGLRRDVDIIRSIRKEFPNAKILVDANDSMDLETIIAFMEQVKDCDIYWVEEPFAENYNDCKALKDYLEKESPQTLLADGEFDYDADAVIDMARKGVLDVLLMDPESFGFTAWRNLVKECVGTSVKCSPHGWGTNMKSRICAHLAAAYPEVCPMVEWAPDVLEGVDVSGYSMKDGILTIPEKPGFGMKLEWAVPKEIYKPY